VEDRTEEIEMFVKLRNLGIMALVAVALPFIVGGCSDDDKKITSPGEPTTYSYVRVAHLSPDAPAVDVWVDGAVALQDVAFGGFSSYLKLSAGNHRIQVSPANQTSPIVIDAEVTLITGNYYTVAATGRLAGIAPTVLVDSVSRETGKARIRFVHAGPDAPSVDITLADGTVLFPDVQFREAGTYLAVPGGTYDLQVRLAGTQTVALSFGDVPLSNNTTYSVFAVGLLSDGSLKATVSVDSPGTGSTTVDLEPATATLRVAHLSPDAPSVDIHLDGQLVAGLAGVPFKAVSGYLTVGAATHNVQVYVAGTTTNPVIDANVTLLPGKAYTVAATGLVGSGDLSPLVLLDNRSGTTSGNSLVRFVHLSPDAPNVDIKVKNGPTLFGNVAFRGFAGYEGVGSGTYNLEVRLSSGGAVALDVPGVELMNGASYTVFAAGLAGDGSLSAVLVKDTP
jgi:hypothetical protein